MRGQGGGRLGSRRWGEHRRRVRPTTHHQGLLETGGLLLDGSQLLEDPHHLLPEPISAHPLNLPPHP